MEGLDTSQHSSFGENLPNAEIERKQLLHYIAGYFDASGIVSVQHNKAGKGHGENFVLRLDIDKVNPTVVDLMQAVFPSFTTERVARKKIAHRWVAKSARAAFVLETISPFLHIKAGHAQAAKDYSSTKTHNRIKEESLEFSSLIKKLNKDPQVDLTTPFELPYLSGIFDAHGYVFMGGHQNRNDISIRIGLKNQEFMEALAKQLNATILPHKRDGVIKNYHITLCSKKAKELLLQLQPFLKVNKQLAALAIEFQTSRESTPKPQLDERKEKEEQILELFKAECARLQRTPHRSSHVQQFENH